MRIRVLLLIAVLMLAAVSATMAQPRYKLRMRTRIWCPYKSYRNSCSGNLYKATAVFNNASNRDIAHTDQFGDGSWGYNLMWIDGNTCNTAPWEYWDSITFDVTQVLTRVALYSSSDEMTGGVNPHCSNNCKTEKDWIFGNWYTPNGYFYSQHPTPSDCYGSNAEIWIFPERIDLSVANGENYLPSTDRITISATAGYPAPVYKWQYNVGGAGWNDFPASTNSYGNSTVSVSGYDLMGADFDNVPRDKNIVIRVRPAEYCESGPLILKPTIPSPHIIAVTPVPNKCFGVKDGTVTVQFDRQLYAGETLNIILLNNSDGQGTTAAGLTALDAGNTYTFPAEYGPGNFTIDLFGNYNGVPCYTGSLQHRGTTTVTGPSAVNFTNSGRNVYCFNGADGTIVLNATGGVGNYSAGYKQAQDDTYSWSAFGSPGQHTITGLDSGVYQLRIYDGNNCIMKDGAGNEVVQTVTITQPAQPVQVDYRQTTNPLAYGYTDGSAMAIIIGGSPFNGNSYDITWTDSTTGSVLNTVTNSINPFTTTLRQIGDGTYIVTAIDSNYVRASGANAAGCMVADTLHLKQPPPLTVAVEEHHYVSCKNGSDGELYAKAQGGIEIPLQRYVYQWYRNNNGVWTNAGQGDSIAVTCIAGTYKVSITDKNNITKEADPFILTQPDVLALALGSTGVYCSGSRNGTASAVIMGGTQPYALQWSTGDTTLSVTGLPQGNYLAFVTDAHGCQTQQQVKVTAPNPMLINDAVVQAPVCTGYCNGAISYTVSGGTAPYAYQWSNGSTIQSPTGLCAGSYSVTVTDAQGCFIQNAFTVQDPLPVTIELGPDRTLCAGQSWVADASITDPLAVYSWTGNNGFTAATPKATLASTGKYKVQVTDSKGCAGADSISISRSDAAVAAEFVSSTQAFKGEKVTFVNISQPWPETVAWLLPAGADITVTKKNDTLIELQFNQTGTYRIGMRCGVGECSKEYSNTITIVEGQSFNDPGTTTDPFVLDFKVAPNPSNGQFTVTVGLQQTADISLRLVNLQTGAVLDQRRQTGSSKYTIPYNISLLNGVYALILETAKDSRIFRVLIL